MSTGLARWSHAEGPARHRHDRPHLLRPGRGRADGRRCSVGGGGPAQGACGPRAGAADVDAARRRRGVHLRPRACRRPDRGHGQSSPVGAAQGRADQRRRAPRHERLLPGPPRLPRRPVPGDRPELLLMLPPRSPLPQLGRQALAEFLGSAGLVTVVIGSGIAASRLSTDPGLQLLENAVITGAGLVALILAFGPVSGGHFNPVVTVADRIFGGVSTRQVAAYLPAQLAGGALGAIVANLMFSLPAVSISSHDRSSGGLWLSEALATFGLVVLIFG